MLTAAQANVHCQEHWEERKVIQAQSYACRNGVEFAASKFRRDDFVRALILTSLTGNIIPC